ncbi:hypothetical protein [Candidatus Uabimicrobium sp. HlEnr_7]|uniref:hypothetical protein n=1 Tax=Candidatus Uabimicrobium helgolandensis TaxID=3095367 RepID=UPI003556C058
MIRYLTIVFCFCLCFTKADTTNFHIRSVVNITKDSIVQNVYFSKEVYNNVLYGKRKNYTNYTQFSQFCANLNSIFINDTMLTISSIECEVKTLYVQTTLRYTYVTPPQKIKVSWHIFPKDILPVAKKSWQLSQIELSSDMLKNWSQKSNSKNDVYLIAKIIHASPMETKLNKQKKDVLWSPKYTKAPQKIKVSTEKRARVASWFLFLTLCLFAIYFRKKNIILITFLALAFYVLPFSFQHLRIVNHTVEKPISKDAKKQIIRTLLHNVYNSFSYDTKEEVYDMLSFSTSGNMLEEIYLEAHRSLFVDAKNTFLIDNVVIHDDYVIELKSDSFQVKVRWQVSGWAVHMGHKHLRTNEYEAVYTINNVNGFWKIVACRVLKQIRILP